jgi:hypothetical protein
MIEYWASMPDATYWATRPKVPPYRGVWTYDIAKKKTSFDGGDFNFAVEKDAYVPRIDDQRATAVEEWLSDLETSLAALARKVHDRVEALEIRSHSDAVNAVKAMFSLQCRSAYNLAACVAALQEDPSLVDVLGGEPGQSLKQVALQNLIHLITERAAAYGSLRLTFLHAPKGGVLLCDRPTFARPSLPTFIALTNRVVAAIDEGEPKLTFEYQYRDLSDDFLHTLNEEFAMEARAWIVAESPTTLSRYVAVVESDKWRKYAASEKPVIEPLRYLTTGFKITKERPSRGVAPGGPPGGSRDPDPTGGSA